MELYTVNVAKQTFHQIVQGIKEIESPTLVAIAYLLLWAFIAGLFLLFVYLFFVSWEIPVIIIVVWILFEIIRAFGVFLQKRKK
jgi:hypothetical protein